MKILIIYSHPNPESFNHAILENLVNSLQDSSDEFEIVDLYNDGFNPILKMDDFNMRDMHAKKNNPSIISRR